jgi:pyruvate-formate lyase-activating enzyme
VRTGLPPLARYARLDAGDGDLRVIGYTETTRGCLDTCRHCPVPAVYGGRFVAIPAETVLADIEAQVEAGARHITFGDPDFLNGPTHGLRILREMHARWPALSFDVTAQVTHLRAQRQHLAELVALGCAFVVSAVESLSDRVLAALAKRHRRADVEELFDLAAAAGLVVRPTFVTFTPWTTLDDVRALVEFIAARGLVDHVDPVQLAIRLLVPPGSLLLAAHPGCFGALDPGALTHVWSHPDPRMDALQRALAERAERAARCEQDPGVTFATMRALVHEAAGTPCSVAMMAADLVRRRVPRVTEPWFC